MPTSVVGRRYLVLKPSAKRQRRRFRITKLEERIAPAIVLVNPGGNTPQGDAQGKALEYQNPAGQAPPGQNKP